MHVRLLEREQLHLAQTAHEHGRAALRALGPQRRECSDVAHHRSRRQLREHDRHWALLPFSTATDVASIPCSACSASVSSSSPASSASSCLSWRAPPQPPLLRWWRQGVGSSSDLGGLAEGPRLGHESDQLDLPLDHETQRARVPLLVASTAAAALLHVDGAAGGVRLTGDEVGERGEDTLALGVGMQRAEAGHRLQLPHHVANLSSYTLRKVRHEGLLAQRLRETRLGADCVSAASD